MVNFFILGCLLSEKGIQILSQMMKEILQKKNPYNLKFFTEWVEEEKYFEVYNKLESERDELNKSLNSNIDTNKSLEFKIAKPENCYVSYKFTDSMSSEELQMNIDLLYKKIKMFAENYCDKDSSLKMKMYQTVAFSYHCKNLTDFCNNNPEKNDMYNDILKIMSSDYEN